MESSNTLLFAFLLAIILIYLVLAAQFESYRDPLIIMFTVPLAIAGALISLLIFGQTLNIFSQIGMIMLIGIVTKNGILIVEFANQKKAKGIEIKTGSSRSCNPTIQAYSDDQSCNCTWCSANSPGPWGWRKEQDFNGYSSNWWIDICPGPDSFCYPGTLYISFQDEKNTRNKTIMKARFVLLLIFLVFSRAISFSGDTLALSEAMAIALENNWGITLAENESRIAELNNSLGNAGFLPSLDATAARSRNVNNTYQKYFDGREREGNNAVSNSVNTGVQLTWTIFDGFNMFIQKKKLGELEEMSTTQMRSVIESTIAQVILAYYDIAVQDRLAEVYYEAVQLSAERKRFARAMIDIGSGSELSYLQSAVDLNTDSAAYMQQIVILANSKAELNRLLCRDLLTSFEVASEIPLNYDLIYEELWGLIQEQNPDLMRARSNLLITSLDTKSSRSLMYPRISVNTGYSFNKSESEVGFMMLNRNLGFAMGISLTYNLFDGFNTRNNIKAAKIREESAHAEFNQAELDMKSELLRIYNDYLTNLQLVKFESDNRDLAVRNLEVAMEKYRIGAINDIDLRQTQQKLMDAETRYLLSQFRSKIAETELLRLSGQLSAENPQVSG
jgi:outer membrane protein TolC